MAVLKGLPGRGKTPSFSKNITLTVQKGQLRMSAWAKKRGKPKSQKTRDQNEWFRQANFLAKYAPGEDQWMAIEVAKNGPWYPRDLLMSAMAGRLFEVINIDGQEYTAVAVRDDVSSDLDFVGGTVKGTILVRGEELWQALVPTVVGHVLTSNGADALPSYQAGGAGGGRSRAATMPNTAFSASAFATKGFPFKAAQDFTIHRVGTRINATAGHTYRGYIAEADASGMILALTGETADVVAGATAAGPFSADLLAPAAIVAGKFYAICWGRRDGADTFAFLCGGITGGTGMTGLPMEYFTPFNGINPWVRLAKAAPAIGDTYNGGASNGFYFTADITI